MRLMISAFFNGSLTFESRIETTRFILCGLENYQDRKHADLLTQEKSEKQDVKNRHCEFPRLCSLTIQSYNLTCLKHQTLVFPKSTTYSGNAFHEFGKDRIR